MRTAIHIETKEEYARIMKLFARKKTKWCIGGDVDEDDILSWELWGNEPFTLYIILGQNGLDIDSIYSSLSRSESFWGSHYKVISSTVIHD